MIECWDGDQRWGTGVEESSVAGQGIGGLRRTIGEEFLICDVELLAHLCCVELHIDTTGTRHDERTEEERGRGKRADGKRVGLTMTKRRRSRKGGEWRKVWVTGEESGARMPWMRVDRGSVRVRGGGGRRWDLHVETGGQRSPAEGLTGALGRISERSMGGGNGSIRHVVHPSRHLTRHRHPLSLHLNIHDHAHSSIQLRTSSSTWLSSLLSRLCV